MTRVQERLPLDSPLCRFLAEREWIIDLDDYRANPQRHEGPPPPQWLLSMREAWAVVPLVVAGELTAIVVLARPHASPHLNWEVRDLLKTASRQAASMLALMRVTETLLEVRKFDAFNRMSAFVVHDLKNIVAQLSLMMQNAKRLKDNPEFQEDMLTTVESSLEKMRRLMLQLRDGQAPLGSARSGVHLVAVLERLRSSADAAGRGVELVIGEPVVARGHEERIERVLGHIMQNALDATATGGSVRVVLERQGSFARVVVSDTGCGMTEEFMSLHLFKPFSTTKDNGMGIGAYESNQYVRELGGSIEVRSKVDQGTEVAVLLPAIEARQRSDLELSSAK
jgi:putative PEP-CTERM system histidine kinase